ncbi:response regulator transcription factor [Alphaproteobacteria bacterium]|nr:response regulator transcription factor [Alphaproteobacteria bacterium]
MYKQKHILVIDDDKKLGNLLKSFLTEKGYLVDFVENTLIAKEKLLNIIFDLLILDVMLPKESGLSFASKLRASNDTPILMLSAMSAPSDRIKGLKTGVDEYLAKPFEPEELLLRIENVIRRSQSIQQEINIIKIGFFNFDVNKNILSKKNASIKLTVKETKVLLHLYKNIGSDVKREKLANNISVSTRTIDVLVKRIREKINSLPNSKNFLLTSRGIGYKLEP